MRLVRPPATLKMSRERILLVLLVELVTTTDAEGSIHNHQSQWSHNPPTQNAKSSANNHDHNSHINFTPELTLECKSFHGDAYFSYYYERRPHFGHHEPHAERRPTLQRFMKELIKCGQNNTRVALREAVLVLWTRLDYIADCARIPHTHSCQTNLTEYGQQLVDHFIKKQMREVNETDASMLLEEPYYKEFFKATLQEPLISTECRIGLNMSRDHHPHTSGPVTPEEVHKVITQKDYRPRKGSRIPDIQTASKYLALADTNRLMCVYKGDISKPNMLGHDPYTTLAQYILLGYNFKKSDDLCPISVIRNIYNQYIGSDDLTLSGKELQTLMKNLHLVIANSSEHNNHHHNNLDRADRSDRIEKTSLNSNQLKHIQRDQVLVTPSQKSTQNQPTTMSRSPTTQSDDDLQKGFIQLKSRRRQPPIDIPYEHHEHETHHNNMCQGDEAMPQKHYLSDVEFVRAPFTSKCLSPRDFLRAVDAGNDNMDLRGFLEICPVLLQQVLSKECREPPNCKLQSSGEKASIVIDNAAFNASTATGNSTKVQSYIDKERGKAYLYGSLSILVISLCSLFGAVFMRVSSPVIKHYLMGGMLTLAVGCLVADAVLHLLPEISEVEEEEEKELPEGPLLPENLQKMCSMLAAIYGFFILELYLGRKGQGHSHSPLDSISDHNVQAVIKAIEGDKERVKETNLDQTATRLNTTRYIKNQLNESSSSGSDTSQSRRKIDNLFATSGDNNNRNVTRPEEFSSLEVPISGTSNEARVELALNNNSRSNSESKDVSQEKAIDNSAKKAIAWMIIIGDAIHNFADGLAIGAAFSLTFTKGLSTSITVFCHELPHELGDFAVLVSTGMSIRRAMVWNFVSGLTAFAGLYVGLVLGDQPEACRWIFAVGAGMFLYVAMTDLIPECKEYFRTTPNWKMFLCQNVGILSGYVTMLLLAMFEDKM